VPQGVRQAAPRLRPPATPGPGKPRYKYHQRPRQGGIQLSQWLSSMNLQLWLSVSQLSH